MQISRRFHDADFDASSALTLAFFFPDYKFLIVPRIYVVAAKRDIDVVSISNRHLTGEAIFTLLTTSVLCLGVQTRRIFPESTGNSCPRTRNHGRTNFCYTN